MPRVAAEHLSARRQQILDAAEVCFSQRGFHKTTMQHIIAQARLSAGAIYNYFNSKDEIIEAIAEQRHDIEREVIETTTTDAALPDALLSLAESFTKELLSEQGVERRRVSVLAWAEALLNPQVALSVRQGLDGPRHALRALIERSDPPADLDPDAMARILVAMFHGFVLQMLWDPATPHAQMMKVFDHLSRALTRD